MSTQKQQSQSVIGIAGSFGSGCTYIADNILKKRGYEYLSLSKDVLRPMFQKETGKDPDESQRRELQDFGDKKRNEKGASFFAEQLIERIEQNKKNKNGLFVIDSIRNPEEIKILRRNFNNFFLFGIYAEKDVRWERVKEIYNNNRKEFEEDDENDTGQDNLPYGQRVGDCFYEADIVLENNTNFIEIGNQDFDIYEAQMSRYVDLIEQPLRKQQPIRKDEAIMAMAYAISQRSSCIKRKVGAVIVDGEGNLISSGYNEVPAHERPCKDEYTKCYRDWFCDKFVNDLKNEIPEVEGKEKFIMDHFRRHFKILDICRASHAEENAIVNLAKHGRSTPLEECVLYTTTYPCRMCANKIVNVGIKQVVYLEPYPDQEAKKILAKADVEDSFFNGVTFKAYFRVYGEQR